MARRGPPPIDRRTFGKEAPEADHPARGKDVSRSRAGDDRLAPRRRVKKIGIVGGIAWPSTVAYYAGICRRAEERHLAAEGRGLASFPEIAIESLDVRRAASLLGKDAEESWREFDEYHRAALRRLECSGAEVAVIAAHTPHHRFAEITRGVGIPVVDLFDVAAREAQRAGARRVLVLGTPVTMDSPALRAAFRRRGIEAAAPEPGALRRSIAEVIGALQEGVVPGAAGRIAGIARRACADRLPDLVCLACTELPLAFPERGDSAAFEAGGVPYLDPSISHVAAALELAGSGA